MAVNNRKITVVVDGTSKDLQAAISKAIDSMKLLGDVTAKQSKIAVDWGGQVIKSNDAVAASYGRVAEAAQLSTGKITAAVDRQATAVRDSSIVVDDATKVQRSAFASVAAAANRSALEVGTAADRQTAAVRGASAANVAASDRAAVASRDSAAKQTAGFAASGSGLVKLGKVVTETAAAVALGSLYMSAKFESSTTRLLTQAGASEAQIKQMRAGILSMAGSLGQTPEHLSEGLYHIVSSMNKVLPAATATNEELKIMRVAAEGAAIGNTSMEETTYALASAMNALHQNAGQAEHTMALLNAIVGSGDMTMGDLLAALKSGLIPTLQTYGISLQSAGAALAVMGDQGMRGALAGTRLRMSLSLIAAPSEKAAKILTALGMGAGEVHARTTAMSEALTKAGLTTTTMASDLRKPDGIVVALKDLKEHLEASGLNATQVADVFGRAFGGGRMSASIMLLAESSGRVGIKFQQIGQQVGQFGTDWAKTHETLTFQAHQALAAVEALGIKIGQDLTPAAKTLLHDLEETAKWLEHNKTAAELLAATITGVLGVAVAAFVANRAAKMIEGLKQIGSASSWLRGGFQTPAAPSVASSGVSAPTTGAFGTASGLMIGGARSGYGLPGSMVNPLVVALESGEFAGLGGRSAAIGTTAATAGENAAVQAESRSAGGVILPANTRSVAAADVKAAAAVPSVVPVGEQAAKTAAEDEKATSGMRTMVGGVMANAMKGGMIALMGTLAADLAGGAIGGHAGNVVKGVGTDAALGAAIGTAIEPGIGTAIGGGLGAIAGAMKSLTRGGGEERADELAHVKGAPKIAQKFEATIARELAKEEDELGKLGHRASVAGGKGGAVSGPRTLTAPENVRAHEIEAYYQQQASARLGEGFKQSVLSGKMKNPGTAEIVKQAQADLAQLKPVGRESFMQFIDSMVQTLEQQGHLPKDSLQKIVASLQPLLNNAIPFAAGQSAKSFSAQFVANINGQEMLKKVSNTAHSITENWSKEFGLLPVNTHMSFNEVQTTANHDLGVLTHIMKTGTETQRKEAGAQYAQLKGDFHNYLEAAKGSVATGLAAITTEVGPEAAKNVNAIIEAYSKLPPSLKAKLEAAGGAVHAGLAKMNKELLAELKELNGGKVATLAEGGAPLAPGVEAAAEGAKKHAAHGMLMQLGRPGDRGRDSIYMSVGGTDIVAAPGEQAAVFTHQQQAVANSYLAPIGGLPGLFSKVNTPHYMAQGGFVPSTAYPGPRGRIDQGVDYAGPGPVKAVLDGIVKHLGLWPGWPGAGGIVYDTSRGNVYVMENFAPAGGLSVGAKLTAGQVIGQDTGGSYGIETGWANASGTAPIVQYGNLPDGTPMPGGKSFASFLGGGPGGGVSGAGGGGVAAKQIMPPHVKGSGVFTHIAQAILNQVAGAANQKLGATGTGSMAGVTGHGGAPSANEALGKQMMVAAGWPATEWPSLQALWTQESGWNANSVNSSSGAYGIPQALGHGHPFNLGDARAQIAWGLNYIRGRYGSPSGAEAHERAFNWYERGGPVAFAPGGFTSSGSVVPKPYKVTPRPSKEKAKSKIIHGAGPKAHVKGGAGKTDIAKKLGPLAYIPGLEETPTLLAPFEAQLAAISNLGNLVKAFEGDKDGPVLLQSDMQYLAGLTGAGVHAGMPADAAYAIYERVLSERGQNPDLELEGSFIKWAEAQADHRLLTSSQAGILSAAGHRAGWTPKAGTPLLGIDEDIADLELNQLTAEEHKMTGVVKRLGEALKNRQVREKHARNLKAAEERRETHLKVDLRRLATASLKDKLSAALNSAYQSERVFDAQLHDAALVENMKDISVIPSKERTVGEASSLAYLTREEAGVKHFLTTIKNPIKGKQASVQQAELAILKNNLNNELAPITERLKVLDGTEGGVSVKGLMSEEKTIANAKPAAESELANITGSKIPTVQINLEEIQRAMVESAIPRLAPPTAAGENTALTEALRTENAILTTNLAVQTAQFAALSNFEVNLPHFEKGGPVLDDGLAYLHRGEHVVPRDGALVAGGGGGNVNIETTHVFQGELAPLMRLIDERVAHPDNVRVVSRHMAQRTQNLPGYR